MLCLKKNVILFLFHSIENVPNFISIPFLQALSQFRSYFIQGSGKCGMIPDSFPFQSGNSTILVSTMPTIRFFSITDVIQASLAYIAITNTTSGVLFPGAGGHTFPADISLRPQSAPQPLRGAAQAVSAKDADAVSAMREKCSISSDVPPGFTCGSPESPVQVSQNTARLCVVVNALTSSIL